MNHISLWRRFSFLQLCVGLILLSLFEFYLGWDVAHPATVLIQH
jgi:hypothetical protein